MILNKVFQLRNIDQFSNYNYNYNYKKIICHQNALPKELGQNRTFPSCKSSTKSHCSTNQTLLPADQKEKKSQSHLEKICFLCFINKGCFGTFEC